MRPGARPLGTGDAGSTRFGSRQASFDTAGAASLLRMKFLFLN
jgi:hypothetical protein